MGTILKSLAINSSSGKNGVVKLVSETAKFCLLKAGVEFDDIGMLINTSVYSEDNVIEPALAALVNKELLRESTRYPAGSDAPGKLLSFDLHNGGGGIINAFQVVDGFVSSGDIQYGLIVSGDVKPREGRVENYAYSTASSAVLLAKDDSIRGFTSFKTETFPEFVTDFGSSSNWESGRLTLVLKQSADYLGKLLDCTIKVLDHFLEEELLDWDTIDMLCTSQSPKGFAAGLQKQLKVNTKIIDINREEIYSAGLLYSLHEVFESDEFKRAKTILFVNAGAGITISVALYKNGI